MSLRTFVSSAVVIVALSALASQPATAAKIWQSPWLEVKSEHFVIESMLPEQPSVKLAVELECFWTMARTLLTDPAAFEERVPTVIYALSGVNAALGVDGKRVDGYFHAGMRSNYAVIHAGGESSARILKHEYVHYLVHNSGGRLYPAWFDEGFAEVLSTLTVKDGLVQYGTPPPSAGSFLTWYSWMPFSQLLRARSPWELKTKQVGAYYAQSWLLVQYLMLGRDGHSFSTEAAEFIRRSEAGEDPIAAFEAAFEIAPRDLDNVLSRYSREYRYFKSELLEPLPIASPKVRALAVDEIAAQLGLITLTQGNYAAAEELYAAALAANPSNGLALTGMGDVHTHAKRYERAEQHYERAVAAEPANANHELDWGEYFLGRALLATETERGAFLAEARRHFARSYAIDPKNPETLDQNGLTYLFDGEDTAKAVQSLEAAYGLLPSFYSIQLHLAQAYAKAGERAAARALLARIVTWSHSEPPAEIKELLASLGVDAAAPKDDDGATTAER